jgi:signal transduction protein with GAF and PtsI domain
MTVKTKRSMAIPKELEVLGKVSSTIASDMFLDDILKIIVAMTAELMGSKICSLMLLNEKGDELKLIATQSLSREYLSKPNVKVGQSISGRAVSERKPITILDVNNDPAYNFPLIAKKEGLVSMLAVPLMVNNKVIGVLNSYTSEIHEFSESEIRLVSAVANQAAVAIYNKQLLEQNTKLEDKLEERKLVEKAKGMLMKEAGITEEEAFSRMRKKSMDTRKSMREIAEAIMLSKELGK